MNLPLTKYGMPQVVVFPHLVLLLMVAAGFVCVSTGSAWWILIIIEAVLLVMLGWVLAFFRDPERKIVCDKLTLVSPADGLVSDVGVIEDDRFEGGKAFRVGIFPFVLLYLCGMYALLWRQCRSSSIAAFVSVLSIAVIPTFGEWFSGIGTLESITPAGLVMVFSPFLMLCYLRTSKNNKIALTIVLSPAYNTGAICLTE